MRQLLERSEGDWAQTLYALFLRALGFGLNGDAMERLAFALPLHLLLKHRDQLPQVEALLLGRQASSTTSPTKRSVRSDSENMPSSPISTA